MNYYPFHLGDYASHTAHLEPMEDLAYRRMLDLYYLSEEPLNYDPREIARLIRMRGNGPDIESVLSEFFVLSDEGWRHKRCDDEIARMKDKQTKARASAEASVLARKANAQRTLNERSTNAERTLNERSTDVKLPTPTPTPTPTPEESLLPAQTKPTPSASAKKGTRLPEDWFLPKEWGEWAMQERHDWQVEDVRKCAERFADFWHSKPGREACKVDWLATWRNWVRNDKTVKPRSGANPGSYHDMLTTAAATMYGTLGMDAA